MSLTNPNTPVSQQDLQDFYHKLLPYMGGSFGMIANKFSKGDLYSTEEKMIGQWIDGKPIYQKTVDCGDVPNSQQKTITAGLSNVDKVVSLDGILCNQTTKRYMPLPPVYISSPTTNQIQLEYNATEDKIKIQSGATWTNWTSYVILQYTKTTDSAISIGNDTDYSTDEKIVGTWIDGKPLYQKTFTGVLPTTSTNGVQVSADITNVLGLANIIDKLVSIQGVIIDSTNVNMGNLYITEVASDYVGSTVAFYSRNTDTIKASNSIARYSGRTVYVTIQYTKTN